MGQLPASMYAMDKYCNTVRPWYFPSVIRILHNNKSFCYYSTHQKLDDRDFSYFLHGAFVFFQHLQHVTIIQKNGSPGESIGLVLCCRNKSIHVRFRDSSDKNSTRYTRSLFLKTLPHSVDACSSIKKTLPHLFSFGQHQLSQVRGRV